jgi:riboflavin kinase/FMN adenylyltransferase
LEITRIEYPHFIHTRDRPEVIAIGDFDGVHLGHQEVINRALRIAEQLHLHAAVMTFHPHPREVLGNATYENLLTPLNKKLEQLAQLGIKRTYIVSFHQQFMALTPEKFVYDFLMLLNINSVIVGFDFTFGYKALGNPDTLCDLSKGRFTVEVVRPYLIDDHKVSSSIIRNELQLGHIEKVTELLGRTYSFKGKVVTGDLRGRTIGFPTANLHLIEPYVIPRYGVYAVKVNVNQKIHLGVMNIGIKPTMKSANEKVSIEVHLFDFHQDIYEQTIEIQIHQYIREEKKFGSIEQLIQQIHQDCIHTKKILHYNENQ